MKRLYIPTSTLNFNNILSSESISPKAFYNKRGFGYSRWVNIPENPFENVIVLYDNLRYFERPKSDFEDHPMLIEVEVDEQIIKQSEGFYYCDHTIYFTPETTFFYFFSEKDQKTVISMSESSLETKLLYLYSKRIGVKNPYESYLPINISEPCELNVSEIDKDIRINKMKGLLYGYYIGAMLSTDIESVKLLNALKEIHNIFASILSSFEKIPTEFQNKRLEELFAKLSREHPLYKEIFSIIENVQRTDKVFDVIKKYFPIEDSKEFYLQTLQLAKEEERENPAISWIKNKIEITKKRMTHRRLCPEDSEIVVIDQNVSILKNKTINSQDEKLCISWMNETLSNPKTNAKISTYREELAKDITLKAKDVFDNSWESCFVRTYLNDLRHHIAGEEFNQKWYDGLLPSIAAVVLTGENWEKMLVFMQSKEMVDYKLAFAFYGELYGFANLTRDFTDIIFEQDKTDDYKKYVWEVYKELYGQLHKCDENVDSNELTNQEVDTTTKLNNINVQQAESIDSDSHNDNAENPELQIKNDNEKQESEYVKTTKDVLSENTGNGVNNIVKKEENHNENENINEPKNEIASDFESATKSELNQSIQNTIVTEDNNTNEYSNKWPLRTTPGFNFQQEDNVPNNGIVEKSTAINSNENDDGNMPLEQSDKYQSANILEENKDYSESQNDDNLNSSRDNVSNADIIEEIKKSLYTIKGLNKDNIELIVEAYKPNKNNCNEFIDKISKIEGIGEKKLSKIKDNLRKFPSIFPIGRFFFCDKNVWWHIESFVEDNKMKEDLKKNLDWVQSVLSQPRKQRFYYNKAGENIPYYQIDEKDNKIVIETFCNLKKDKTTYETLRGTIKDKLMKLYNVE